MFARKKTKRIRPVQKRSQDFFVGGGGGGEGGVRTSITGTT